MIEKRRKTASSKRGYKILATGYFVLGGVMFSVLFCALFSSSAFNARSLGYLSVLGFAATLSFMGVQYLNQSRKDAD
jgi:hypothetical protein